MIQPALDERWEWIPGFEGEAAISDQGRIFHIPSDKLLTPYGDKGCQYVRVGEKGPRMAVGRTVLIAFTGYRDASWLAMHINGLWHDNRLENLKWGTRADIGRHSASIRTRTNGKILPPETRRKIKSQLLNKHGTMSELAAWYGVSEKTIRRISDEVDY